MLSLKVVVIRGAYSWAVAVDNVPVIAYGTYKQAALDLKLFEGEMK